MNISISFFSLISVAIGEKVSLGCQIPQISSLIANGFIHIIPNSRYLINQNWRLYYLNYLIHPIAKLMLTKYQKSDDLISEPKATQSN
jgi:hypothetical protein